MYEAMRLVLAGVVREFVDDGATRSERLFRADDLEDEDKVKLPDKKIVRVTFEYVPADIGG